MNSTPRIGLLFFLVVAMLFSACRSRKQVPSVKNGEMKTEQKKSNELVIHLRDNQSRVEFFSAKIKTSYMPENGKDLGFTLHLKMQKGKYIWLSATAILGIEGARIYITHDSIKILDKINRRYLAKDYTYFKRYTDAPINLEALQNLFIGNQILPLADTILTDTTAEALMLKQLFEQTLYLLYVNNNTREIGTQQFVQQEKKQELSVHYIAYQRINGVRYANKIELNASAKERVRATFDFQNVSFNPIEELIFSIPPSYSPME